ncbi:hypothetical protein TNCV_2545501 [Trichonephila clavipes]|nr:hypothetical protein TNCV_2545501 [Trichonephila clavipes]
MAAYKLNLEPYIAVSLEKPAYQASLPPSPCGGKRMCMAKRYELVDTPKKAAPGATRDGEREPDSDCRKPLILLDIAGMSVKCGHCVSEFKMFLFLFPYRYLTAGASLRKIRSMQKIALAIASSQAQWPLAKWWANCTFSISDAIRHSMKIQMQCTALKKWKWLSAVTMQFPTLQ